MTDFRELCAELVDAWDDLPWEYDFKGNIIGIHGDLYDDSAVDRARAALSQPEPEGPPQPIPVSERLPGPVAWMYRGDPDFDGTTWRENWKVTTDYQLAVLKARPDQPVPLLPAHALPMPTHTSEND